jgi:hypothetical protein
MLTYKEIELHKAHCTVVGSCIIVPSIAESVARSIDGKPQRWRLVNQYPRQLDEPFLDFISVEQLVVHYQLAHFDKRPC